MTYKLTFLKPAKKEWDKLSPSIKNQFKIKLTQRLELPHVPKDRLTGMIHCYKIKLRTSGYRLVYKIIFQYNSSYFFNIAEFKFSLCY